jgi:hypothetical protein
MDNEHVDLQKIIVDLLDQNVGLRLELAMLRAAIQQVQERNEQNFADNASSNIPPEALEMISKLDIR